MTDLIRITDEDHLDILRVNPKYIKMIAIRGKHDGDDMWYYPVIHLGDTTINCSRFSTEKAAEQWIESTFPSEKNTISKDKQSNEPVSIKINPELYSDFEEIDAAITSRRGDKLILLKYNPNNIINTDMKAFFSNFGRIKHISGVSTRGNRFLKELKIGFDNPEDHQTVIKLLTSLQLLHKYQMV